MRRMTDKLTAEAGADAGDACELLLERYTHGPDVMHHLDTPDMCLVGAWSR